MSSKIMLDQDTLKKLLINILIIIGIAALGVFLVNQSLQYIFKMKYLNTPCDLCAELNKNQSQCVKDCFIIKDTYYYSLEGWKSNTGNLIQTPQA